VVVMAAEERKTVLIRIPPGLHQTIKTLAKAEDLSANEWISQALALVANRSKETK
jgi:predicted HicB family RNase H-like nuclease